MSNWRDRTIKSTELELMLWHIRETEQVNVVKLDTPVGWHSLTVSNRACADLMEWLWANRNFLSTALIEGIQAEIAAEKNA